MPFSELSQMQPGEPSAVIRERVIKARQIQTERFKPFKGIHCNAMMTEKMLHEFAEPDAAALASGFSSYNSYYRAKQKMER